MTAESFDVAVLGAGAAGLHCAALAGARGKRVVLLEHQDRIGQKIAISGGGRCNFTNLHARPEHYLSARPDFCKSALARSTPQDFLALVQRHRIPYHEKKLGQLFCDGSARAIIEMLLAECAAARVDVRTGWRIEQVEKPERFRLHSAKGVIEADALVIATGGLSFAKLGATDFGHRLARQFGLAVTPLRPGLVPLTWSTEEERATFGPLSGVALPVIARSQNGASFPEAMLFTHRGVSGPAVLQISSHWREGETVEFDLLPPGLASSKDAAPCSGVSARRSGKQRASHRDGGLEASHRDAAPGTTPRSVVPSTTRDLAALEAPLRLRQVKSLPAWLGEYWPQRLAETWSARYAPAKSPAHYKDREIEALLTQLHRWPLRFTGTEGYPKAEVTLGGVETGELSSKTMEARKVPGLYFIGEVMDVTGWLGGYNFQWAWSSAAASAQAV